MRLGSLRLLDFRSYRDVTFEFHPRINLVVGPNASGKTSLVEAIHYLGHLQSFRTSSASTLIRSGEERFLLSHRSPDASSLGVLYARGRHRTRLDGSPVQRRSQLMRHFPQYLLHPGCHAILEQGPVHRRRFMDQILFHVKQDYHRLLFQYRHLLRQRNASLRRGGASLATAWDPSLSELASMVTSQRRHFVCWIRDNQHCSPLAGHFPGLDLRFLPGWQDEEPLLDLLSREIDLDLKMRQTRKGPHKADLAFLIDGYPARQTLSRGQSKLFLLHLVMLSLCYLREHAAVSPLLLLDDLSSELDQRGLDLALDALEGFSRLSSQVLLTTTRTEIGQQLRQRAGAEMRLFHVEQGNLRKVV